MFLVFCVSFTAKAQQIINKGLEPFGSVTSCVAVPVANYNSNMGNCWIGGLATQVMIGDNSCLFGPAAEGTHFTGLKYTFSMTTQESNILVLKLDAPLTPDTNYKITYSYKLDVTSGHATNGIFSYGYTHDSMSHDSTVGSTHSLTATTWTTDTLKIKPKKPMQYIFLDPSYPAVGTVLIYVDNFKVLNTPASVGNMPSSHLVGVKVFPNPFHGSTQIDLGASAELPCKLHVYDMTGREVLQRVINERSATVDRGALNNGIYFMRVTDNGGGEFVNKLVVQ